MSTGALALIGVFALAALCVLLEHRRRRRIDRRLAALGFEACDADEPAIQRAWEALVRAPGGTREREIRVGRCLRRAAGWGMAYRFRVSEKAGDPPGDEPHVGAHFDAWLVDLRDPDSIARSPLTLFVLPPGSSIARALVRRVIEMDPPGRRLELGDHAWSRSILAAYGGEEGKLDDVLAPAAQEKLARAAERGFFRVHLSGAKAGFAVLPGHRDVDAEWAYLAEWC